MERLGGEDIGLLTSIRKVVAASFLGATIEWYAYFIYGTATALVFSQLFFSSFSPFVGTPASLGTFAIVPTARYSQGGALLITSYIPALCASSVLCYALAQKTYRKDIYEEEPRERQLLTERR
ncbi:MAG: hypothetical protein M3305_15835 [Actinomycetota bacterium]|jgi:hypothetical protein|nr:hypothetical protein [Actinomycetota bacterium]